MTYRVNLNIDKTGINPQMFINKTEQLEGGGFGEYTEAQMATQVMLNAIYSGHQKGNVQSLRRTLAVRDVLDKACLNGGVAELDAEDFRYLKSSFAKADQWNNTVDTAILVDRVFKTLEKAEEIK